MSWEVKDGQMAREGGIEGAEAREKQDRGDEGKCPNLAQGFRK